VESTLIKVLVRLHDASEARVTVGGQDLRTLDVHAWRSTAAGAFQDFLQPPVSVREAIGIGRVDRIDDMAAVRHAAERARADRLVTSLPDGYETQLGPEFPGGVELSAGQWQPLALARASMHGSLLLITVLIDRCPHYRELYELQASTSR
jgi:ATP-binding cassette subfamily B protein